MLNNNTLRINEKVKDDLLFPIVQEANNNYQSYINNLYFMATLKAIRQSFFSIQRYDNEINSIIELSLKKQGIEIQSIGKFTLNNRIFNGNEDNDFDLSLLDNESLLKITTIETHINNLSILEQEWINSLSNFDFSLLKEEIMKLESQYLEQYVIQYNFLPLFLLHTTILKDHYFYKSLLKVLVNIKPYLSSHLNNFSNNKIIVFLQEHRPTNELIINNITLNQQLEQIINHTKKWHCF